MKALNFTKPCQTQFVQHTQYTSYELATSVCFLLTNRSETLRWGRALIVEREDGIEERSFKRAKIQQLKCDSTVLWRIESIGVFEIVQLGGFLVSRSWCLGHVLVVSWLCLGGVLCKRVSSLEPILIQSLFSLTAAFIVPFEHKSCFPT